MQIALLVTPFNVLLGWIIHADMTLFFNTFETAVLFITVLYEFHFLNETDGRIVNYLIQDGKSNYLEGGLLMAVYLVWPPLASHWLIIRLFPLQYGTIHHYDMDFFMYSLMRISVRKSGPILSTLVGVFLNSESTCAPKEFIFWKHDLLERLEPSSPFRFKGMRTCLGRNR